MVTLKETAAAWLRLSLHSMDTSKRREVNASTFHLPASKVERLPRIVHNIESYNRRKEEKTR